MSSTHTLFHPELYDARSHPAEPGHPELRVISRRWSLSAGARPRWSALEDGENTLPGTDDNGVRVYPLGWHPTKATAVEAYRNSEEADRLALQEQADEHQRNRELADAWLICFGGSPGELQNGGTA